VRTRSIVLKASAHCWSVRQLKKWTPVSVTGGCCGSISGLRFQRCTMACDQWSRGLHISSSVTSPRNSVTSSRRRVIDLKFATRNSSPSSVTSPRNSVTSSRRRVSDLKFATRNSSSSSRSTSSRSTSSAVRIAWSSRRGWRTTTTLLLLLLLALPHHHVALVTATWM